MHSWHHTEPYSPSKSCNISHMRPSLRLLQHTARVTLFTRESCSLCDTAKLVLKDVAKTRGFDYFEIDVMDPAQKMWKHAYEFDTPVVNPYRLSYSQGFV